MNWIDAVLVVTILAGVVMSLRMGYVKAEFLAAGIVAGWFLAMGVSDELAAVLVSVVWLQSQVALLFSVVIIALSAAVSLLVFRRINASRNMSASRPSTVRAKFGDTAVGLAVGVIIAGVLVVTVARVTFDGLDPRAPFEMWRWKEGVVAAMRESAIVPLYVRAARQVTTPALTTSAFDIAIDWVDASLDDDFGDIGCTIINEDGKAQRHGSGRRYIYGDGGVCAAHNAVIWWPRVMNPEGNTYLEILCGSDSPRDYMGRSLAFAWGRDWCAYGGKWISWAYVCNFWAYENDYRLLTSNEESCDAVQQIARTEGWPPPITSLPFPR